MKKQLTDIFFSQMPFAVYAVDIESFEIIYMNEKMKKYLYSPTQRYCWDKIYGQQKPCSWCKVVEFVQSDKTQIKTQFFDEAANKWLKSYDQLIILPTGERIKYTIIIDITEQKEVQGSLINSHAQLAIKSKQLKELNQKLNTTLDKLNEANEKLTFLAKKDPLTGINNRRTFFEIALKLMAKYPTKTQNLYGIMIDIDNFKHINDRYGHSGGDEILRLLSIVIAKNIRQDDTFGRLGGEEFAILLIGNCDEDIIRKVDNLREIISKTDLDYDNQKVRITVSIGIASKNPQDQIIDTILERADQGMYKAKKNGRNRVIFKK